MDSDPAKQAAAPLPEAGGAPAGRRIAPKPHGSRLMRVLFMSLGVVALTLGILGAVLPVLPTTPFILLSAACFARSSERFHGWLLGHRIAGPIIRDWQEHRSMPPGVKPWAFGLMALSFGASMLMMNSAWHRAMLAGLALILGVFLWRVPVRSLEEDARK